MNFKAVLKFQILILTMLFLQIPRANATTLPISGSFQYLDRDWDFNGWTGGFSYKPIRNAKVVVTIESQNSTKSYDSATDMNGNFLVHADVEQVDSVTAVVFSERPKKALSAFQMADVKVKKSGNIYALSSETFIVQDTDSGIDLGVTTADIVSLGQKIGSPFNIYDEAIASWLYLTDSENGPGAAPKENQNIELNWPGGFGSYATGNKVWISSDDGYDDSVILHEIGHAVHHVYSDSDNPGGIHYFGDSGQNGKLSFGEGYATFFGAQVLVHSNREPLYVDSKGQKYVIGGYELRANIESGFPFTQSTMGSRDEINVARVLHDLLDHGDGDDDSINYSHTENGDSLQKLWWELFVGPLNNIVGLSLNDAWDRWFIKYNDKVKYEDIAEIFINNKVFYISDQYEPLDNTSQHPTPLNLGEWSDVHTLYSSNNPTLDAPGQKDQDWFSVQLVAGDLVTIKTHNPNEEYDMGSEIDPMIKIFKPNLNLYMSDKDSGFATHSKSTFLATESGTWFIKVEAEFAVKYLKYGTYKIKAQLESP